MLYSHYVFAAVYYMDARYVFIHLYSMKTRTFISNTLNKEEFYSVYAFWFLCASKSVYIQMDG